MKKYFLLIIIIYLSIIPKLFAQQGDLIRVVGDSLIGKMVNGESVREVYGNVVLTQGNVVITCNKAIQYISRNEAELIGNVIAKKDTLTIKTARGFYFGNLSKTKSNSGVYLDDKKVILTADSGEYFFNEDRAVFETNVKLFDTTSTLTSTKLNYFQKQDRAVAIGNVKIVDPENEITADTLEHFRKTKITFAFSNVRIKNLKNNTEIYGEHLEDFRERNYSIIDIKPLLLQVDTTYITREDSTKEAKLDTLFIKARLMESFRDSSEKFIATDSVLILKDEFASRNDLTLFYKEQNRIVINKISEEARQPIIWYKNSQLTGDSITIYLDGNKITKLDVNNIAFMMSQNEIYDNRFDQTSSDSIKIYFANNKINEADFFGKVYSIYYLYEGETKNGLTKSNSSKAKVLFKDDEVSEVKLYINPASEYYPEKQVNGNEKSYLLPRFIIMEDRPTKEEMYQTLKQLR
ncbi:MAG TPA: OstA-like protein [Ignavibacteriaceae bacterium]|nr:OstA-like protein [Ignavibacteriaceae bacterium]